MATEVEGSFQVGTTKLHTKTWLPDGPPVAKLIFVHGFSDHVGRYYGFFPSLSARGIAVYAFDQRGWGRSVTKPAEKGLTGGTDLVMADLATFVRPHLPGSPLHLEGVPVFLMGHSMGGGEAICFASDAAYEDIMVHIRGLLLEAPFVAFPPSETPSSLKVILGRLAGRFLPRHQLVNEIPPEKLSRDPEVQKSLREDELCHDTGTLEGLAALLDRTDALQSGKIKLGPKVRSLWVGHGTQDKATWFEASKKWFDAQDGVQDKTYKAYDGWFHQLHAEPEKQEFYEDVADWILTRCGTQGEGSKTEAKL